MARAGDKDTSGQNKEQPQDVTTTTETNEVYEPRREDIRGDGASDQFGKVPAGELEGEDVEKAGSKPPDAMGAGA